MTDGAAKAFEGLNLLDNPTFKEAYRKLTSTNPADFWTSGQWMTEKGGGSDVANGTETVAIQLDLEQHYKLYGYKWFSSASDANMALTLARICDDEGNVIQGSKGLTLFYVPVKENNQSISENIHMVRLKNKLGTRQLPTAELLLDGAFATKVIIFMIYFKNSKISSSNRFQKKVKVWRPLLIQCYKSHEFIMLSRVLLIFKGMHSHILCANY